MPLAPPCEDPLGTRHSRPTLRLVSDAGNERPRVGRASCHWGYARRAPQNTLYYWIENRQQKLPQVWMLWGVCHLL